MRTETVLPRGAPVDVVQRLDDVLARPLLVGRRDGVLDVEEDVVGGAVGRLVDHLRVGARNGEFAALQPQLAEVVDVWLICCSPACSQAALAIVGCADTAEMLDRRADARAGRHLDAAVAQRHFGRRQRAADHHLVEPAEMADAEHLACDLVEADAERGVVFVVGAPARPRRCRCLRARGWR